MEYSPNYFRLAVIVSACGLVVLALIILIEFREGRIFRKLIKKAEMEGGSEKEKSDEPDEDTESLAAVIRQMTADNADAPDVSDAPDAEAEEKPAAEETPPAPTEMPAPVISDEPRPVIPDEPRPVIPDEHKE